jgi:hypothetical protein
VRSTGLGEALRNADDFDPRSEEVTRMTLSLVHPTKSSVLRTEHTATRTTSSSVLCTEQRGLCEAQRLCLLCVGIRKAEKPLRLCRSTPRVHMDGVLCQFLFPPWHRRSSNLSLKLYNYLQTLCRLSYLRYCMAGVMSQGGCRCWAICSNRRLHSRFMSNKYHLMRSGITS